LLELIGTEIKKETGMDLLTKLEELILLSVWKLKNQAYGKTIYQMLCSATGKKLSLGGIYFPLERLLKKGLIESTAGETTEKRRGHPKKYYKITDEGKSVLMEMRKVNEWMWSDLPAKQLSPMGKKQG
jgi:DNA-binding PadR family transcriptional regulator